MTAFAHLTLRYDFGYIWIIAIRRIFLDCIMTQEHGETFPPIPFTDDDLKTMHKDDAASAKTIALLSCSIFGIGLILYIVVLIAVQMQALIYTTR
jgi:hypothetical protein